MEKVLAFRLVSGRLSDLITWRLLGQTDLRAVVPGTLLHLGVRPWARGALVQLGGGAGKGRRHPCSRLTLLSGIPKRAMSFSSDLFVQHTSGSGIGGSRGLVAAVPPVRGMPTSLLPQGDAKTVSATGN